MRTKFPLLQTDPALPGSVARNYSALAGGATAQTVLTFPVGINRMAIVSAIVLATVGAQGNAKAITSIDTDTEVVTLTAHGYTAGQPVVFGGTAAPTGLTAGTIYYLGTITTDTFKVYATLANALAESSAINITAAGTAATVRAVVATDVFKLAGVVSNRGGTVAVLGTPNLVSFNPSVVAANCTLGAGTGNTGIVKIDANGTLATKVEVLASIIDADIAASA